MFWVEDLKFSCILGPSDVPQPLYERLMPVERKINTLGRTFECAQNHGIRVLIIV
jgi:hypothetical protein